MRLQNKSNRLEHPLNGGQRVSLHAVMPPPTLCRVDRLEAQVSVYSSVRQVSTRGIIKGSPERQVRDQLDGNASVSLCFSLSEPEPVPSSPYQHANRSE